MNIGKKLINVRNILHKARVVNVNFIAYLHQFLMDIDDMSIEGVLI